MSTNVEIKGFEPECTRGFLILKEYEITGYTLEDFQTRHGGADFDFDDIQKEFEKHCTDYAKDLEPKVASKAVHFCSVVLFEIGPESRKVKKGTGDKTWKLFFPVANEAGVVTKHVVHISTFKGEGAVYKASNTGTGMLLTLKMAGLLAQVVFSKIVRLAYSSAESVKLMTPLAGACFSKDDILEFASAFDMSAVDILVAISQSTQTGGHYLPNSDVNIAVICAVSATRGLKDVNLQKSIVVKTLKQYIAKGRKPDIEKMNVVARFATGGVPLKFSYEEIIQRYESVQQVSLLQAMRGLKDSAIKPRVDPAPGGSGASTKP